MKKRRAVVRLSAEMIASLDRLAARLREAVRGRRVSRAEVVRLMVAVYLDTPEDAVFERLLAAIVAKHPQIRRRS